MQMAAQWSRRGLEFACGGHSSFAEADSNVAGKTAGHELYEAPIAIWRASI
jgi:hypothetical protein